MRRLLGCLITLCAVLAFSGCKTSEERAEQYYQSGLALLEAGEEEGAISEFQNALQRDDLHKGARFAVADILLKQGRTDEAYSQYLGLIERFPDDVETRLALAEMALSAQNFEAAERDGAEAMRLAPANPHTRAVQAALDYNTSVQANDAIAITSAVAAARKALVDAPDSLAARRVVIFALLNGPDPVKALPDIEIAIAQAPDSIEFQMLKLNVFSRTHNSVDGGAQMKRMYEKFPDNTDIRTWLYEWYVAQGDTTQTLAFLRDLAGRDDGDPEQQMRVVQFIRDTDGPDAAAAELLRLADTASDRESSDRYRALGAAIAFEQGRRRQAISMLKEVITKAEPSKQTNDIKVALARMLAETDDVAGASALIDEVLQSDTTQVDALKLRGTWLLQANKPREALEVLRTAIDLRPRDPEILTMLGKAYESDGSAALAGRNLALAVEVSGSGVEESLLFYKFLVRTGRPAVANSVLATALQANPDNVALLTVAADKSSAIFDWPGAEKFISRLQGIDSDPARAASVTAKATLQRRKDSSVNVLDIIQHIAGSGNAGVSVSANALGSLIEAGKLDEARAYLADRLANAPTDPDLLRIEEGLTVLQSDLAR